MKEKMARNNIRKRYIENPAKRKYMGELNVQKYAVFVFLMVCALLFEGQTAKNVQPFMQLSPVFCVALVVLAFTFLGDGLRDALDPRMHGTQ
jgi:ABC-type dipeptide/oligopeptide/nickel transport system permease subunit